MSEPAPALIALTRDQRDTILHALGVDRPGRRPWRNWYCDSVEAPDLAVLVTLGAMKTGRAINGERDRYYHVTEAGAYAAGVELPKPEGR